jgi:hypothetical protein
MSQVEPSSQLLPDLARSVLAAIIAMFGLGGWAYSFTRPDMRAALPDHSVLWWTEQLLLLAHAVACIGILLNGRMFVVPAILLSGIMLLFGAVHWWQALLLEGRLSIPITPLLIALFMWRLLVTRRAVPNIETHAG